MSRSAASSLIALVSFLALCAASHAGQSAGTDDVAESCSQLLQHHSEITSATPSRLMLLFRTYFDPSSFVSPIQANPHSSGTKDLSPVFAGQTVRIFTLGRFHTVTPGDQVQLNEIQKEQNQELQSIRLLLRSKTKQDCVQEAMKIGWSPSQLTAMLTKETADLQAIRHEEAQLSLKMAREGAENVVNDPPAESLRFEIVPVDSWGEVIQSLRSRPASGMILIAHADANGRLYDSLRDELPSGFFRGLPPSVRFIGVFSCESEAVTRSYGLDQLAGREVLTVKLGSPFNETAATPIQFFPSWMEQIESEGLLRLSSTLAPESECTLSLSGLQLREGALAVTMRGLPVGVWSSENETDPRLIPCSWLDTMLGAPSLFLEPSRLDEKIALDTAPIFAEVSGGDEIHRTLNAEEIFTTDSGAFRSAILSEEVPSKP